MPQPQTYLGAGAMRRRSQLKGLLPAGVRKGLRRARREYRRRAFARLRTRGDVAFASGDWKQAIQWWRKSLIYSRVHEGSIVSKIGQAYASLGKKAEAIEAFDQVAQRVDSSAKDLLACGRQLLTLEQKELAIEVLRECLRRVDPSNASTAVRAANLIRASGYEVDVAEILKGCVEAAPDSVNNWLYLGNEQAALGLHTRAVSSYYGAIRRSGGSATVFAKASEAAATEDLLLAEMLLVRACSASPRDASLHFRHGRLLERLKHPDLAANAYFAAIELDSRVSEKCYERYVRLLRKDNRLARSEATLADGLRNFPNSKALKIAEADIVAERKDYIQTFSLWRSIVEQFHTRMSAREWLRYAAIARAANEDAEAKRATLIAVALAPEDSLIKEREIHSLHTALKRIRSGIDRNAEGVHENLTWRQMMSRWEQFSAVSDHNRILAFPRLVEAGLYELEDAINDGDDKERLTDAIRRPLQLVEDTNFGEASDLVDLIAPRIVQARLSGGGVEHTDAHERLEDDLWLRRGATDGEGWRWTYHMLLWNGLFTPSLVARHNALAATVALGRSRGADLRQRRFAFVASVESGDFEQASDILDQLRGAVGRRAAVALEHYLRICSPLMSNVESTTSPGIGSTELDRQYTDYLADKSVAVVGPVAGDSLSGPEIDSFDVVIRPNYRGKSVMADPERSGSRTDVSYYSGAMCRAMEADGEVDAIADLRFAATKSINLPFLKEHNMRGVLRPMVKNDFMFHGSPNMIQNIVYDVLCAKPRRVKVFNTDLYVSKESHFDGYRPTSLVPLSLLKFREKLSLEVHDPVSQFIFTRSMVGAGQIEVDAKLDRVLNMTEREYVVALSGMDLGG